MTDTTEEDPLEVRPDGRKSRYVKRGDNPPVAGFDPGNPDDITTLDERVALFWEKYPSGVIETDPPAWHEPTWSWVGTARVWKADDTKGRADSTGSALEPEGEGRDYPAYETAESRALSRALRFLSLKPTTTTGDPSEDPAAEA